MVTTLVVSESSARRYALGDPDVRLMLQVRDGDAVAFEELVLRYQQRLVVVLDHRLMTKPYGREFLRALPDIEIVRDEFTS